MTTKRQIKDRVGELCAVDNDGKVHKSLITIDNYEKVKTLAESLDIEIVKETQFGYRQYCKLLDSYIFKEKKCDGEICCQALNKNGTRCTRAANKFTSINITESQISPKLPTFIKNKLGAKKTEELKLLGFANSCCFYCWQHAAMFAAEKVTWSSNLAYYSTHVEDLLSIFFDDVKPKKLAGTVTYSVENLGKLRSTDEIVKHMYKTLGVTQGALSTTYWAVFATVFMYDTLKPIIINFLSGTKEEREAIVEKMGPAGAAALLQINK